MSRPFEALPKTIIDADAKMTSFLLAWRDWVQVRQELAGDMGNHALHDKLAQASVAMREAFGEVRAQFRFLQQCGHLRGGALRSPKAPTQVLTPLNRSLNLDDPKDVDWLYQWARQADQIIRGGE